MASPSSRKKHTRSQKAGQPPGYLNPSDRPENDKARVLIMEFTPDRFTQREMVSLDEIRKLDYTDNTISWINVFGVRDVNLLKVLGEALGLNSLAVEDIATTDQRPRVEDYGNNMHIVLRTLKTEASGLVGFDQLSIVLNKFVVVTFQETMELALDDKQHGVDILEPIRERIRSGSGIIRNFQEDYIAYRVVDAVIDSYLVLLESLGESIDRLQDQVLGNPSEQFLGEMHRMRRNVIILKRSLWPLRSVVQGMKHSEGGLFDLGTQPYLRDATEHVEQVIDSIETMEKSLSSALEIYLTSNGNRMNDIMRVLTVLSAFFIPLTFIVGVYGMNFRNMPEISWRYGYLASWILMCVVVAGMVIFFRRKKWM